MYIFYLFLKEKYVVDALPDNKSAQDEVKNHKANLVNVSSPSCQSESKTETVSNDAELSTCKVVVRDNDDHEDTNKVATVNVPQIKIDSSDDGTDSNEDLQVEWEWEEGEEMEYEFYEHEL